MAARSARVTKAQQSAPTRSAQAAQAAAVASSVVRQTPSGRMTTQMRAGKRPAKPVSPEPDMFDEIGTSGLRQYGGFVFEEWLAQLQGRKAAWVYREMMDNSPIIGAILFAIEWMARRVTWRVEEGSSPGDAEFVEQCMHDMDSSWGDFITEGLSMLPYGYSFHETVLKRRQGRKPPAPVTDDQGATSEDVQRPASSQYSDGKIGWRAMPGRAQETLLRWEFDGYSAVSAFVQIDWHGGYHIIPVSKGMLFRSRPRRDNPEGYSILRPAVVPFIRLKTIEQLEAIGIERDLAGIPVATPPDGVDLYAPQNSQLRADVENMVTSIRRDEFEGVVLPTAGWKLELMSAAGSRQIDTDQVARRYETQIATTMLADFLKLGTDQVGSFALASVKTDLFAVALDGILDLMCEVMNPQAVVPLLELNGRPVDEPPTITHSSATQMDLQKVGQFLYDLSGSGAPIPWNKGLLEALFDEAGLPTNFDEGEPVPKIEDDEPDEGLAPVAPPQLPYGQEPFARETHMGQPAPAPAAGKPAVVQKAEDEKPRTEYTPAGMIHRIAPVLRDRQARLSEQLEREINSALDELGRQAEHAYLTLVQKADIKPTKSGGQHLQSLVAAIMRALRLRQWVAQRLDPIFKNHAQRVTTDTQRVVTSEIGLRVGIDDDAAQKIAGIAGTTGLGLKDIEPQVRRALLTTIRDGQNKGLRPEEIARQIRDQVPAGRFTNAGPAYRSRLIARTETANMQRVATVEAYKSNPRIQMLEVSDGVLADSDADCRARDGNVVSIENADSVQPLHPQCTLSLNPIVAGSLPAEQDLPEPELITI